MSFCVLGDVLETRVAHFLLFLLQLFVVSFDFRSLLATLQLVCIGTNFGVCMRQPRLEVT